MDKIFLDQTFKLYKSNDAVPKLTQTQLDYISHVTCQYLFDSLANDIISDYKEYQDLLHDFKITNDSRHSDRFNITYISIRHRGLLPRQTIIFIKGVDDTEGPQLFNTLVLIKTTNSSLLKVLIQAIENLPTEIPIVVRELKFNEKYLNWIVNNVSTSIQSLENHAEVMGEVELIYQTNHLVSNDALRNIIINIPEQDIQHLSDQNGLIHNINDFLKQTSEINFNNLPLVRFTSRLINLSQDGKLKISSDKLHLVRNVYFLSDSSTVASGQENASEDQENPFIWFLLRSIYNENLTQ